MNMDKNLFICGDLHGEIKKLIGDNLKLIKHSDIVCVGDFGVGFGGPNSSDILYKSVENKLKDLDVNIYTIRGNHDNPEYFDGLHDFERLKFLQDHKIYTIQGKDFYTIGGATSLDIDYPNNGKSRRVKNEELIKYNSKKRVWWKNEIVDKKLDNLPFKVDYIISHEAPVSFPPVPIRDNDNILDETWNSMLLDRNYLDSLVGEINAVWWFYGHYHQSFKGHQGNLLYKGLKTLELFKL